MGDVGLAVQRAEDKTQSMQARAGAIDELLASGALNDPTGTSTDDIQLELDRMSSTNDVESQLAAMKGQLAGAPATPAIEGAATTATPAAPAAAAPVADQPVAQPEESS
jgi:phage shock protein A